MSISDERLAELASSHGFSITSGLLRLLRKVYDMNRFADKPIKPVWDGVLRPADFITTEVRVAEGFFTKVGVRVLHIPTGKSVTSMDCRSVHANRQAAWDRLKMELIGSITDSEGGECD